MKSIGEKEEGKGVGTPRKTSATSTNVLNEFPVLSVFHLTDNAIMMFLCSH